MSLVCYTSRTSTFFAYFAISGIGAASPVTQREKGRSLSMALVAAPSMAQRAALSASLAPRARLFDV